MPDTTTTESNLRAWHGDPKVKEKLLARIGRHEQADAMRPLSRPHSVRRPTENQRRHLRRLSARLGIEEPVVHTAADARKALNRLERYRDTRSQLTLEVYA